MQNPPTSSFSRAASGLGVLSERAANTKDNMKRSLTAAQNAAAGAAASAAERSGQMYKHVGQKVAQGAAVWPAAAANKRSITDTDPWSVEAEPCGPFEVRVCSWNLHGHPIHLGDEVEQWLTPGDGADIYVVGVQEIVELGAKSVVWNTSGSDQAQNLLEARVENVLAGSEIDFVKVCSFGMVGLAMLVYIRRHLVPHMRDLDCDRVKTGLEGLGGNKGAVCVRFRMGQKSFCFANVHLASGQNEAHERNQHLTQIISDAFQGTSSSGSRRAPKQVFKRQSKHRIAFHDLSVIFGDFNSRLDLAKEETWPAGKPDEWLKHDQLLLGQAPALKGFREGMIVFPPTYKYKEGTDDFNTKRAPAWTDRIVFKADPNHVEVEMVEYDSYFKLKRTSDHKPIAAQFHVLPLAKEREGSGDWAFGSGAGKDKSASSDPWPSAGGYAQDAPATAASATPIPLPDSDDPWAALGPSAWPNSSPGAPTGSVESFIGDSDPKTSDQASS